MKREAAAYSQSGGAAWFDICANHLPDWQAKLAGTPFENLIKSDISGEEKFRAWITAIEQQDALFQHALEIIAAKCKVKLDDTDTILEKAVEFDSQREELLPYIIDVNQMINFNELDVADEDKSKLEMIYFAKDESLTTLLLFPDRVKNVFLYAIAKILVTLKKDDSIIRKAKNPAVVTALGSQYTSYAEALAATLTAHPLRDGFFTNQPIDSFRKKDLANFWGDFINELYKIQTDEEGVQVGTLFEKVERACHRTLFNASWGFIVANLYTLYKIDKLNLLWSLFNQKCENLEVLEGGKYKPRGEPNEDFLPDKDYWNIPIVKDIPGTTLTTVLSAMDDTTFQFLLQLSHMIKQVEAEETEGGAATPA